MFLGFPHGVAQKQSHDFVTDVLEHGRSGTGPFVLWRCLEMPVMGKEEFGRYCWLLWRGHDGIGDHVEFPTPLVAGLEPLA